MSARGWRWLFFDERPEPPPLSAHQWLDIAVDGLVPDAAERVRAEHLAHLEDALESGETEAGVVAGWGDPWAAWRKLRRVHPTRLEAGLLPPPYRPGWGAAGKSGAGPVRAPDLRGGPLGHAGP